MKNNILLILAMLVGVCVMITRAEAVQTSGNIPVVATIAVGTPDMAVLVLRTEDGDADQNPWTNSTELDTGLQLLFDSWTVVTKAPNAAQWIANTQNNIYMFANGMGDAYNILVDGTGSLTNAAGTVTLPATSLEVIPISSAQDAYKLADGTLVTQGAIPTGATLGAAGSVLGQTGKSVYSSEGGTTGAGSQRIVRLLCMFPPFKNDGTVPYTGYLPIAATTAAGTYGGANCYVTVRIVAK